jgi:type III secretion system low calcium response chaperone LcrH/SycD
MKDKQTDSSDGFGVDFEALVRAAEGTPPIDPEAFYAHAYDLYQLGKTLDALEVFQVLCSKYPLENRFWLGLAAACQESANYARALQAWAMSALLDPENPYPHFHAAECATSLNQKEAALLALAEAKALLKEESHPLASTIAALEERWRNA